MDSDKDYYEELFYEKVLSPAYDFRHLAWKEAEKGNFDLAEIIARSVNIAEIEDLKIAALAGVACSLAKAGYLERAESIAKSIECHIYLPANEYKINIFLAISYELVKTGNFAKIKELMIYAEESANAIDENGVVKAGKLCRIGQYFAQIGDREHAISLYEQAEQVIEAVYTEKDQDCEGVLDEIRSSYKEVSAIEQAERITNSLQKKGSHRAYPLNNSIQGNYIQIVSQGDSKTNTYISYFD